MIVKPKYLVGCGATLTVSLAVLVSLVGNSHTYVYKVTAVPYPVKLSPRLANLFEKKKFLCFGRYAIEVPQEAQVIIGSAAVRERIEVFPGGLETAKHRANEEFKKVKWEDRTAEITYNGPGPIAESWQVRYFSSEYAKEDNTMFFGTYLSIGEFTFGLGDAISKGENENMVASRQHERSKSLRLHVTDELPVEAGFCIEHGFIANNQYEEQEMISAGIYLPSLPDVTFSVSSNKDAYADYPKARFEEMKRDELPLLARIKSAQAMQGAHYPKRDVLREGKRDVQHWNGEESLIRRPDGTHDFEWAFVGTPKDVANPSEFHAVMFSKVKANMVGAAKKASVTDDEAVALWDKLLSGLKFRVKVPGSPEGSYFLPKTQPNVSSAK